MKMGVLVKMSNSLVSELEMAYKDIMEYHSDDSMIEAACYIKLAVESIMEYEDKMNKLER